MCVASPMIPTSPIDRSRIPEGWRHPDGRVPTGSGVTVAVIDSGWDRARVDPRIRPGVAFVNASGSGLVETRDDHDRIGHGTACANLILDVAPNVGIVPVRVFEEQLETSPAAIEAAIDWSVAHRVNVINLSLATVRQDARNRFYRACVRADSAGIILVSAAWTNESAGYPSAFDLVVSVAATDWADPLAFDYTPDNAIECRSPGLRRQVVTLNGQVQTLSGTSFAAPNIAGIVALWKERWPNLDLSGVRRLLAQYAVAS